MAYVGIEAGGTKVVCGTGTGPDDLGDLVRIPTTTPPETLGAVARYVEGRAGSTDAVGLATFGPVDLVEGSPTHGRLTTTPKPGWAGADLLSPLRAVFDGPIGLDTDVNGAALAELAHGAGRGLSSLAYVTVGTGIGGGAVVDGRTVTGLAHPEMGHLLVRRHPDDGFPGRCPSHGDCLEGLACGPAWLDRWGATSAEMAPEQRVAAVEVEAFYLAQLAMTLVLTLSPQRIILGGGVLAEPLLLPTVRTRTQALLAGYVDVPALAEGIRDYLVPPGLGDRAGVLGAIELARAASQPSPAG